MPYDPTTDRRTLLGSGLGMAAFAAASAGAIGPAQASFDVSKRKTIKGASLKGPYLDLSLPKDNVTAYARISGNIDCKTTTHGWYDGLVMGTAPGGPIKNICGMKGMSSYRMEKLPDGGYRRLLREVGYYYDLATGAIIEEMVNPYTGEKVKIVPINNDPFNMTIKETISPPPSYGGLNTQKAEPKPFLLKWRIQQPDRVIMERHIHLYYKNALDPKVWQRESSGPMVQVSEFFNHVLSLDDVQNEDLTHIPYSGTWSRSTPWLPWLLMGQAEGNCIYQCFMGGTGNLDSLPEDIVKYTEKNFPKYLRSPDKFEEPSLSSIEWYSRTQKPAPPRGGV